MFIFPNLKKSFSEIEDIWVSEFGRNFFDLIFYIIIAENHQSGTKNFIIPKNINGKIKNAISHGFFNKHFEEGGFQKVKTHSLNELMNLTKRKHLAVILGQIDIDSISNMTLFCMAYFQKFRKEHPANFQIFENKTFKWTLLMWSSKNENFDSKELTAFLEWFKKNFEMNKVNVPTYLFCKNNFTLNYLDTWKIKMTEITSENRPSKFFYSIK